MLESLIGFAVLLGLILLRVPIAFAMAAVGGIGFALLRGWQPAWAMTGQIAFDSALSYSLSVIPLFIFMGNVLAASGVAHGLFAAADRLFGRTRGGLAMATIVFLRWIFCDLRVFAGNGGDHVQGRDAADAQIRLQ